MRTQQAAKQQQAAPSHALRTVAAVLAAAAAAPDLYAQQQASLAELRAQAPAPAMLRAAVVFAGHPRTFLTSETVRSNVIAGVDALCATIKCEVFAVVAKTDGSLFPNPAPHAEASCRGRGRRVPQPSERGRGPNRPAAEDPHPNGGETLAKRTGGPTSIMVESSPTRARPGRSSRKPKTAFCMILFVRLRFDVVWVRPPPSLWTSSCRRRMMSFQT